MHHSDHKTTSETPHPGNSTWNTRHISPSANDTTDPTSVKKLRRGEGTFDITKCLLGFDFDGINKTIWLDAAKRASILTILHQWIRGSVKARRGIPFTEFELVVSKLRHAFTALREGRGLLGPCNWTFIKMAHSWRQSKTSAPSYGP